MSVTISSDVNCIFYSARAAAPLVFGSDPYTRTCTSYVPGQPILDQVVSILLSTTVFVGSATGFFLLINVIPGMYRLYILQILIINLS